MKKVIISVVIVLGMFTFAFGQDAGNERSADRTLRGSGRVNASTLGMEFDLPLGSYPGRGINVPINLSYSSKLWRLNYMMHQPNPGNQWSDCFPHYIPEYSENSASGWTTSLAVPYIEYVGAAGNYDINGKPVSNYDVGCPTSGGGGGSYPFYFIRRILVHLPSGETHEMRVDDTPLSSPIGYTGPGSPGHPTTWDATYHAADGSNIKYIQSSASNTYKLLMPDGSFYDFNAAPNVADRKATRFTDRNGNFTTYHAPNTSHPYGYWTDTLGRLVSVPIGTAPPGPTSAQNPQVYSMPGITGTYKLHWKNLNGGTQAESALTDINHPNYQLRYYGSTYVCNNSLGYPAYCTRTEGNYLFNDGDSNARIVSNFLFNPVVLTEIELPTGQKYKFSYDVYGRIEKITYPTGGEEIFQYGVVATLAALDPTDGTAAQANFGVINRKVYPTAGQVNYYQWTYGNSGSSAIGYPVVINNPDGTRTERYLHPGNPYNDNPTPFGFDNVLAGMAFEERVYDSSSPRKLVSKKLTSWTKTITPYIPYTLSQPGQWHPRVAQEESIIYDTAGNGVSATTAFEYEGDLSQRETPLLMKKSSQYEFVTAGSPLPSNPVRSSESTFLINDPNYAGVKSYYTAQNMVGIVTASQVKDGAGTIVSRSEMVFDESGRSPGYRGNPTTAKVWDSTKGAYASSSAYISTSARFDSWGNQYEATDAKGNTSTTTFDPTYQAFPISSTSPIPDPNPSQNPDGLPHGSQAAFVTTATFDTTTGLPLTTTDANGLESRIEYDPVTLRPIRTKNYHSGVQVGGTSETIYNDQPNNYWVKNRSQIDTDKWAESITYFDGLGRAYKSEQVDSQGNIFTEKEFDADGRVSRVTNPFRANETKIWTTNVYDEASRIKEVVLPDGAKVITDYGVSVTGTVGITKQITDQAGKKRKGFSDALGRMIRVIEDPTGQNLNTDYVFDTLGNLRKTIQGEQSRYFLHDTLGRLLYAKQPEQDANTAFVATDSITSNSQWSAKYEYDDNSNITRTTDARGIYVAGTYDKFNRIILRDYSDATPDVGFFYDGTGLGSIPNFSKGKTTKVTSSVSETRNTSFDNLGRLLTHQQITDGQTYSTAYSYNLSGALIEETYPSGRVVKNTLNADGDLSQVQSKRNSNFGFFTYADSISRDSAGNVKKMQLGNGRWETASYNSRLQITQIGLGATDNAQDLLKLEYDYTTPSTTNNNGSLREQKITVPTAGGSSGFTAIQTYTYDDLNRLQSAEEKVSTTTTWKQTFTIDKYGNRKFDAANTTTLGSCPQIVCNPDISAATNRLVGYGFDANGNVTTDAEGKTFLYDAENHQKEVKDAANNTIGQYLYDGEGKRVKKVSNAETVIFVYSGGGTLVAEYSTTLAPTQQVSYLTADHLGSPRVITDQNGIVTSRKDFTAFGEETITAQRTGGLKYQPDNIRQDYTGYQKDDESGLEFAQARYYNTGHGRFTSVDPLTASASIKNPQTFNRYSYVLNSPYKFVDPLGLLSVTTGACGSGCPGSLGVSYGLIGLYSDNGGTFAVLGWDSSTSSTPGQTRTFVRTGSTTYEYQTVAIPVATGSPPANVRGRIAQVQIFWQADEGYILAADGKTKIKAFQATGEIQTRIVDSGGKEFTGKKDAPIAAAFKTAVDQVIAAQGFDNKANCHGTTFAGGQVVINDPEITKGSLKAMGFRPLDKDEARQGGDVALYKGDGGFVHSATYNADVSTVRSKGGIEPLQTSVAPGPGPGTAWKNKGSIQVWTTRVKEKK